MGPPLSTWRPPGVPCAVSGAHGRMEEFVSPQITGGRDGTITHASAGAPQAQALHRRIVGGAERSDEPRARGSEGRLPASGQLRAGRGRHARERFADDVLPEISGSALATLEAARDPHVRSVVRSVSRAGQRVGVVTPPKSALGPGTFVLIGLAACAVAGVAYAAWQTLRADDDLWIEDLGDPGSADIGDDD
jgi:hypothetical protein